MRWLVLMGAVVSLGACATLGTPRTPREVVEAQAEALRRGDGRGAWSLLSAEAQAASRPLPPPSRVAASLEAVEVRRSARWSGAGEPVVLERGADGWRIRAGVLGLMRADTLEEALGSFAVALVSRDYAALLRLVPDGERPQWTVERIAAAFDDPRVRPRWLELAEGLRAGPTDTLWLEAGRARVSVGERQITLVREASGWKVFDVTPASEYTRP